MQHNAVWHFRAALDVSSDFREVGATGSLRNVKKHAALIESAVRHSYSIRGLFCGSNERREEDLTDRTESG